MKVHELMSLLSNYISGAEVLIDMKDVNALHGIVHVEDDDNGDIRIYDYDPNDLDEA